MASGGPKAANKRRAVSGPTPSVSDKRNQAPSVSRVFNMFSPCAAWVAVCQGIVGQMRRAANANAAPLGGQRWRCDSQPNSRWLPSATIQQMKPVQKVWLG